MRKGEKKNLVSPFNRKRTQNMDSAFPYIPGFLIPFSPYFPTTHHPSSISMQ